MIIAMKSLSFIVDNVQKDQEKECKGHKYFAMCRLCKGSYRSCVFLPCCHILFCWNCGQHFISCDECQSVVNKRMHVEMGRSSPN